MRLDIEEITRREFESRVAELGLEFSSAETNYVHARLVNPVVFPNFESLRHSMPRVNKTIYWDFENLRLGDAKKRSEDPDYLAGLNNTSNLVVFLTGSKGYQSQDSFQFVKDTDLWKLQSSLIRPGNTIRYVISGIRRGKEGIRIIA